MEFETQLEYGVPYGQGIIYIDHDGKEHLFTGLAYDLHPIGKLESYFYVDVGVKEGRYVEFYPSGVDRVGSPICRKVGKRVNRMARVGDPVLCSSCRLDGRGILFLRMDESLKDRPGGPHDFDGADMSGNEVHLGLHDTPGMSKSDNILFHFKDIR